MLRAVAFMSVLLAAAPAGAQFWGRPTFAPSAMAGDSRGPQVSSWLDARDVRDRIDAGRSSGALSRHDAHQLRRELGAVGAMADRFAADGLSADEQRELETRLAVLRDEAARIETAPRPTR